jgi:PII-like signaling protein
LPRATGPPPDHRVRAAANRRNLDNLGGLAMRVLEGEQLLMRIFIGEGDRHHHQPLYQALVELLRTEKIAGATVLRGTLGFGAKSHLHTTQLLRLSQDLPMVVEVVDSPENIDRVMPKIDDMVQDGLITLEKVRVVRYSAG